MRPDQQLLTGKLVPICLLATLSVAVLVVLAFYLLPRLLDRGPALNLDRPSPFEPVAQQDAIDALSENQVPQDLVYRLEDDRILDVRYRSRGFEPAFELKIDELEIVALDDKHWPPLFGDLRLHRFDLAFDSESLPPWLERVRGDAVLTYRFNPESSTLDLPEIAVQVPGLGLLEAALSLDDVNPAMPLVNLSQSGISTLSLTLQDEGLIGLSLDLLAYSEDIPVTTLRQNLYGLASLLQSESGFPFLRELLAAVKTVMQHRGDGLIVSLSATPEKSFPIARLSRLKLSPLPDLSVLNALNLRIEAR